MFPACCLLLLMLKQQVKLTALPTASNPTMVLRRHGTLRLAVRRGKTHTMGPSKETAARLRIACALCMSQISASHTAPVPWHPQAFSPMGWGTCVNMCTHARGRFCTNMCAVACLNPPCCMALPAARPAPGGVGALLFAPADALRSSTSLTETAPPTLKRALRAVLMATTLMRASRAP